MTKLEKRVLLSFTVAAALASLRPGASESHANPASVNARIPITDMGVTDSYFGFAGGLYPEDHDASGHVVAIHDDIPADHLAAGKAAAMRVQRRALDGTPSPVGSWVLLTVGMSNCDQASSGLLRTYDGKGGAVKQLDYSRTGSVKEAAPWSFLGQVAEQRARGHVNQDGLEVINGAWGGHPAPYWTNTTIVKYGLFPEVNCYDFVRDDKLAPNGLSEAQVQVIWLYQADSIHEGGVSFGETVAPQDGGPAPTPIGSPPYTNADAFTLALELSQIARTCKARYPNLQMIFVSTRESCAYSIGTGPGAAPFSFYDNLQGTGPTFATFQAPFAPCSSTLPASVLNPEPFAYETGFAVKWLLAAQIFQMRNGGAVSQASTLANGTVLESLDDANGEAPWLAWGPYNWTDGATPRRDGLFWNAYHFSPVDATHPGDPFCNADVAGGTTSPFGFDYSQARSTKALENSGQYVLGRELIDFLGGVSSRTCNINGLGLNGWFLPGW